ncbi:thiolase domain-containing protein [Mycobacteroides abscessus]|uniref:thiolase domain-containing protein n=1 Tax=Mycobacteroides abscessus TaxID=36809 RepID=UPI00078E08A2|nr:thiolase domain-containing protein [Mycobacteroides abscessus]AMU29856.1 acetyl-CoA acetyltransferase [Mycobacteroides abscessus]MDM2495066.1 thiolase domain-containing protein [Mycobacteroides abscessus]MDM2513978.1 thiolase domain-containing protein [Mycobacteroides abscessus]MDM2524327.1 thiolase domain-containing protein [Mycobacteroides abscessus]MDM2528730.1 thiolase domain-containing protein [Mycobacteroides abscessus]
MSRGVAVVGVGQSKQAKKREVTIAALVREAVDGALADAELTFGDIDAIVLAKTPDLFDGVMNPELYLADAIGARGLPVTRVFTGGSVGGHAAIYAAHLIQARLAGRVLVVAYSKESEGNFTWALSRPLPFSAQLGAGAGGHFAPVIREYIRRSHAPEHIGWQVAVNHRLNATRNPYAHIHKPDITIEEVRNSPMLWDPIRFLESCPSSDGSCAVVISSEMHARLAPRPPAWIHGTGWHTETGHFAGRDEVNPRAGQECAAAAYREAGITDPGTEVDVSELYIPYSWYEPMWMENIGLAPESSGWRAVDEGHTAFGGRHPINPSGGVLSGNPTGATGLLRFAEAALQVRGLAGEHQVDGARRAIGHAMGGASQFHALWVVGSEKP